MLKFDYRNIKSEIIGVDNGIDVENEFALYPNPVKEHLTIKCPGFYEFEIRCMMILHLVLLAIIVNYSLNTQTSTNSRARS